MTDSEEGELRHRQYRPLECFDCHRTVAYMSLFGTDEERADWQDNLDNIGEIVCFECIAKHLNSTVADKFSLLADNDKPQE